jgi:hypothetical protein
MFEGLHANGGGSLELPKAPSLQGGALKYNGKNLGVLFFPKAGSQLDWRPLAFKHLHSAHTHSLTPRIQATKSSHGDSSLIPGPG